MSVFKLWLCDIREGIFKNKRYTIVPFICIFTFGEYGYREHSANTCGGLMLSFTGFGKE